MASEVSLPTLHRLSTAQARTGLSRSSLYREIYNENSNPSGRLKIIKIGRSVRVSEQELSRFIESLGS